MPNDRTPYLQDLIKYSRKATLLIHRSFVDGTRKDERFEKTNNALDFFMNDKSLYLIAKDVEDEYLEITISLKEDEDEDNV